MVAECIVGLGLSRVSRIIVALPHHAVIAQYADPNLLLDIFDSFGSAVASKISLCLFHTTTMDVVETVTATIQHCSIKGPVFVKDADNRFDAAIHAADTVITLNTVSKRSSDGTGSHSTMPEQNRIFNIEHKSFCSLLYDNIISNIFERSYFSSVICVGGYGFSSAALFMQSARSLRASVASVESVGGMEERPRLRISDVVFRSMLTGHIFFGVSFP